MFNIIETASCLGETIKTVRKKQKLTQAQLAASCGVGVRFIQELEGGKESCHLGKTLTVLQALGLTVYTTDSDFDLFQGLQEKFFEGDNDE
jgi:y4mF family transcriptional regulator